MAEYIEKAELIKKLCFETAEWYYSPTIKTIKEFPVADVQPVKRGKWDGYICSECNVCADYFISGDFYFDEKPDYCPNCGARMIKDGDKK